MIGLAKWIPWFPLLGAAICGICATRRSLAKFAPFAAVASIAAAFVFSLLAYTGANTHEFAPVVSKLFTWIDVGDFQAHFSYYLDPLTFLMLFVVTGIGTLVAWYAGGYMLGDRGYARFFAFVCLFLFAMTTLVMADNLVLLYLGWEGVGLCSYLLVGFYYKKPSAVAAGKKAFIVNRIGDVGFALGIFLTYLTFGSVEFNAIIPAAWVILDHVGINTLAGNAPALAAFHQASAASVEMLMVIPFLLMLGAFGKSAQIPLYVWLPDAMEGPTPVSALIHAATMVTAGVYMIARLVALFQLSPAALPTVAVVGGVTALFAGTIATCQNDLKKVFAYSTVSQLGYMFLGVGVAATFAGVFHLFTHAFFKALLFLTAGSVMHAAAGQLDMKKLSGLRTKMPVTFILMGIGCLALAGFPLTSGFFSKDEILAEVMHAGLAADGAQRVVFITLGFMGLFTALLTAYYTFRLFFRVFFGPTKYEMGAEHSHGDDHALADAAHTEDKAVHVEHHHDIHEMPMLTMNLPLIVLAVGALFAGLAFGVTGTIEGWVDHSTAAPIAHHAAATASHATADHGHAAAEGAGFVAWLNAGHNLHNLMMLASTIICLCGIGLAWWYHLIDRDAADRKARQWSGLVRILEHKYYVDEIYDAAIVRPLRALGELCFAFDRLVVDALVSLVGFFPRMLGLSVQPLQRGMVQGYGLSMVAGAAVLTLIVLLVMHN